MMLDSNALKPSIRHLLQSHARHQINVPAMRGFKITAYHRVIGQLSYRIAVSNRINIHAIFRQRVITPQLRSGRSKPEY